MATPERRHNHHLKQQITISQGSFCHLMLALLYTTQKDIPVHWFTISNMQDSLLKTHPICLQLSTNLFCSSFCYLTRLWVTSPTPNLRSIWAPLNSFCFSTHLILPQDSITNASPWRPAHLVLELPQGDPVEVIFKLCARKSFCKIKELGKVFIIVVSVVLLKVTVIKNMAKSHVIVSDKCQEMVENDIEKPFTRDHMWCSWRNDPNCSPICFEGTERSARNKVLCRVNPWSYWNQILFWLRCDPDILFWEFSRMRRS